jgi:chromate transport protein ChrA
MAFSAVVTAANVLERRSNKQPSLPIIGLAGVFIAVAVVLSLIFYLSSLFEPYERSIEAWLQRYPVYVVIWGIILSSVLFWLRRRRKDRYGYLEIIIGLTVLTFFAVNPYPGLVAFIVGFATPVYIMIRGAVNIDEYKPPGP